MATSPAAINISIRRQVLLERLKSGESLRVLSFLETVANTLRKRLSGSELTTLSQSRLERLLESINKTLGQQFADARMATLENTREITQGEVEFQRRVLGTIAPQFESVVPPAMQIRAVVLSVPLAARGPSQGLLLSAFLRDSSERQIQAITGVIRRGAFEGQTNAQIRDAVIGTPGRAFRDGTLAQVRRSAESVVRTAVQHISTVARDEFYAENRDIITGVRWVATLDAVTCQICQSLDGQVFKPDAGPRPPIHINCRCTTAPELDGRFAVLGGGGKTRSAEFGPVPAKQTYFGWLKNQPAEVQDMSIGPTRGKLLRSGGLTAERFRTLGIDRNFEPLTLSDMQKLEPVAFVRAGIDN